MILKNWPNDARIGCVLASKGMENFCVAKNDSFDDFKDELEEGGDILRMILKTPRTPRTPKILCKLQLCLDHIQLVCKWS
jgi:hypothetical protein